MLTSIRKKDSRGKYHQAIKFLIFQKEKMLADKMALDMMYNSSQKAKFHKTPMPNNIDNIYDDTSISNKNVKHYIIVYLTKQMNSTC